MMGAKYFIAPRGGAQSGPYSLADVRNMLQRGQITADYLAWHEGMPDWAPVMDVMAEAERLAQIKGYTMIDAVVSCFKRYAEFSGRAGKAEYWWFFLVMLVVYVVGIFFTVIGMFFPPLWILAGLLFLCMLGMILPMIAVGFRRMQDVGKHGAYIFIPIYGNIILALEPSHGPNQYGSIPAPPAK